MKIGLKAVQIAIAGFVIPYMAVYSPALMLQGDWTAGRRRLHRVQGGAVDRPLGCRRDRLPLRAAQMAERIFAAAAAFMLVAAIPLTDEIGFAMSVVLFGLWHLVRSRRADRRAASADS
jgi:TRAP-type uncharacterized transport system fused permease subunit